MKRLFGKKGFTLIEIVIVIVLLSILAAVAYPKYLDLRDDAHKSADLATISALRAGVHIYFAKYHEFPDTKERLEGCLEDGELPDGWTIKAESDSGVGDTNQDGDTNDFVITCDGLPSTGDTQSWVYDVETGSITMVAGGHGFGTETPPSPSS